MIVSVVLQMMSCGVCSGGNSGHEADSDQDACGTCFGDVGDCDGDGTCDTEDASSMW